MTNPAQALPPKIRAALYWGNLVAGLIIGSLSTWFLTTTGTMPTWLAGVVAVGAFLSAGIGAIAGSNVNTTSAAEPQPEPDMT